MIESTRTLPRPHHRLNVTSEDFWSRSAEEREASFLVLRDEDPVSWQPVMGGAVKPPPHEGVWVVTRYADVQQVSRDPQRFVSGEGVMFNDYPPRLVQATSSFIAMDAPRHTRLRKIVSAAFTPRQIRRMDQAIHAKSVSIVDGLLEAGQGDFVELVSTRLPVWTINEMIGLDGDLREEARRNAEIVVGWADDELAAGRSRAQVYNEALQNLITIGRRFAAFRRETPGDDLMTNLVNAEVDGRRLTDEEIGAFFVLLTIAGNDTTASATSNAVVDLHRHPDQKALLLEDVEGRIDVALEECLRWASPLLTFRRTAAVDTELQGRTIRAGDWLALVYPSANRDERVFADPDRFDITRYPNPHLAFGGGGVHFCLGVSIARRQLREIFTQLMTRVPHLEVGEPEHVAGTLVRAVKRLPCSVR